MELIKFSLFDNLTYENYLSDKKLTGNKDPDRSSPENTSIFAVMIILKNVLLLLASRRR
jgi:hypothetical protein